MHTAMHIGLICGESLSYSGRARCWQLVVGCICLVLGLPQDPNNLLFGESATILFCAPKSGALTFQKHAFFVCGGHAVG